MVDGQLESKWSQLHYATRTLSPVRLVLKVTLFLLLYCTGVFLCFWGVLTRLDLQAQPCNKTGERTTKKTIRIAWVLGTITIRIRATVVRTSVVCAMGLVGGVRAFLSTKGVPGTVHFAVANQRPSRSVVSFQQRVKHQKLEGHEHPATLQKI